MVGAFETPTKVRMIEQLARELWGVGLALNPLKSIVAAPLL